MTLQQQLARLIHDSWVVVPGDGERCEACMETAGMACEVFAAYLEDVPAYFILLLAAKKERRGGLPVRLHDARMALARAVREEGKEQADDSA